MLLGLGQYCFDLVYSLGSLGIAAKKFKLLSLLLLDGLLSSDAFVVVG